MSSAGSKKRKATDAEAAAAKKKAATSDMGVDGFETYSLEDIRKKLPALCKRVPEVPGNQFGLLSPTSKIGDSGPLEEDVLREWAATMQAILEEFNLLICCVATATYKWGTERSGAADQNLGLLSGELSSAQEQIASTVTPRLTNVLAPVVDLVIEKTVKTQDSAGLETKENHFTRQLVDPDFLKLCYRILARNAPLLRQVVLSNFNKILHVLKDYLKAQENDTQHSRGFTY